MFDRRHSYRVALLLLPALFVFSVQSALEVFHPIEEDVQEVSGHHHADTGDGPALYDSSHEDSGAHEHHYCAHSNAFAYFIALGTTFQHLRTYVTDVRMPELVLVRPFLANFERGPPSL